MNNQEILDNAPEWADTHRKLLDYPDCTTYADNTRDGKLDRALVDIKRIVELEGDLNIAKSIIIKTANNIIEADNCEQDSDEMNECWDCLKDFALTATGRCDT